MSFSVLFVCTGNVCRSPMAELLLRAAVPNGVVDVRSAGVHALVDEPMDYSSAAVMVERGIDPGMHRARQYEPYMGTEADLILTAEVAHRDAILSVLPRAMNRTFTMREFARLASRLQSASPVDVVAQASQIRGIDGAVTGNDDDMPDPFRGTLTRARTIADGIDACVRDTVAALGLDRPSVVRRPSPGRRRPLPPPVDTHYREGTRP